MLFYVVIKVYECYYYRNVNNEIPREIQISQNAMPQGQTLDVRGKMYEV